MEDDIKNLNYKDTIIANLVNIVMFFFWILAFRYGLQAISKIEMWELQTAALFTFVLLMFRVINFRFVFIYNAKSGGLIRYN